MISDTLSDAIEQIRRYQETQPAVYAADRARIDAVIARMDELRAYFDGLRPEDIVA